MKEEALEPRPVITITASSHPMVVREVGQDKRIIVNRNETRRFTVPYLGLLIGYVEKAGA